VTADYDAIVYDLDGTLVELDVDWDAARDDAAAVLSARGVDTTAMGLWDVLEAAEPNGILDRVNEAIAEHEREGARTATSLPLADELPHDVPVGVCSLNSEAACRIALELHGLDGHVDAVVGRDSTGAYKPDPQPLLETVAAIGAEPPRTLFIGDGQRDALTAERAGLPFQYVADRLG
jgi:phosphoglycolate phosphatase